VSRPRDRVSAGALLPGMEARPWKDSDKVTYRYHHKGKPINLGTDRAEAIRQVLDMTGKAPGHGTVSWLWPEWKKSKRWKKLSAGTQADYELAWKQIDPHLGRYPAASITAPQIARYVHITRADSPRRADIEKSVLSGMFKHGIMLGVCLINPTDGVEPHGSEPVRKMPQEAALRAFLEWLDKQPTQRRIMGFMAEYASLAGNRRCEFLDLTWPQVDREAKIVRTFRAKQRGKRRGEVVEPITITPALDALLDRIKALGLSGLYVFPNRDGNAQTEDGWSSMWNRCRAAAIEAKVITRDQRFDFHSLRHYYATMHRVKYGTRPNMHADERVTARVYDETREEGRSAL
jgi:integrase